MVIFCHQTTRNVLSHEVINKEARKIHASTFALAIGMVVSRASSYRDNRNMWIRIIHYASLALAFNGL